MAFNLKQKAVAALRDAAIAADETVTDEKGRTVCCAIALDWVPVRPGTLRGAVNGRRITDDGHGKLLHKHKAVGSIHYISGSINFAGYKFPGKRPIHYKLTYRFDSGQKPTKRIEFTLTIPKKFRKRMAASRLDMTLYTQFVLVGNAPDQRDPNAAPG